MCSNSYTVSQKNRIAVIISIIAVVTVKDYSYGNYFSMLTAVKRTVFWFFLRHRPSSHYCCYGNRAAGSKPV